MYKHRNTFTPNSGDFNPNLSRFQHLFTNPDGVVIREGPILRPGLLTTATEESGSADFYLISFLGSTYRAKNVEL